VYIRGPSSKGNGERGQFASGRRTREWRRGESTLACRQVIGESVKIESAQSAVLESVMGRGGERKSKIISL